MGANYLTLLGGMLEIAWRGGGYAKIGLEELMPRIYRAAVTGCVVLSIRQGWIKAFATYSFFTESEHQKLLDDPNYTPPLEAWNCSEFPGSHAWVMDVISPDPGYEKELMLELRTRMESATVRVHYYRTRKNNPRPVLISKVVSHGPE